jgi:hypothetical protein
MVSEWVAKCLGALALGLVAGYFLVAVYGKGYTSGKNEVLAKWSASQVVAEQAVRDLEHTWQDRVIEAGKERDAKVQQVADGAARAAANTDRLHRAAIAAQRNACQAPTGTQGRGAPSDLFPDVLERVGSRTGEIAAYADNLRAALDECRGSWPQ